MENYVDSLVYNITNNVKIFYSVKSFDGLTFHLEE